MGARWQKTVRRILQGGNHAAARFMQMAAVVELALGAVGLDVGHQAGQVHGLNVVQSELLKSWRINHGCCPGSICPVKRGAGGRVLAGVQRRGDSVGEHLSIRYQPVDQCAFARA